MKKFLSLILALCMVMSMAAVVSADNVDATPENLSSVLASANSGDVITLADGNYIMPEPDLRGRTLTIKGTRGAVIDVTAVDMRDQFVTGATLTFDGVTLNFGTAFYMGFANCTSLTYKDCAINGLQFLTGPIVTFEGCSLNSNGAEHCVWTYDADEVVFTNCTFTYADRAVNVYSDQSTTSSDVSFDECIFTKDTEHANAKTTAGAIEINSSIMTDVDLSVEDTTVSQDELWWVSDYDNDYGISTSVKENGVEYAAAEVNGEKYIALGAAIQAAQDGDTITLLDDIKLVDGGEYSSHPGALVVDKDVIIDLAGHDIDSAAGSGEGIEVAAEVTIKDSRGGSSVSVSLAENTDSNGNITITGGSYTDDVTDYIPEGVEFEEIDGEWVVGDSINDREDDDDREEREPSEPTPAEIERDRVVAAIKSAEDGETVVLDVKDTSVVSRFIADAMSGKNVNLEYALGEETVTVNGKSVPKTPAYRVWYSLELFKQFA